MKKEPTTEMSPNTLETNKTFQNMRNHKIPSFFSKNPRKLYSKIGFRNVWIRKLQTTDLRMAAALG